MSEIICKATQGVGPIRNPKSKYHVSKAEYAADYYPPYCQGTLTPNTVVIILDNTQPR